MGGCLTTGILMRLEANCSVEIGRQKETKKSVASALPGSWETYRNGLDRPYCQEIALFCQAINEKSIVL